jgi:hypothetical protein
MGDQRHKVSRGSKYHSHAPVTLFHWRFSTQNEHGVCVVGRVVRNDPADRRPRQVAAALSQAGLANTDYGRAAIRAVPPRVQSHGRFKDRSTESLGESGMKRMRGGAKRQRGWTPGAATAQCFAACHLHLARLSWRPEVMLRRSVSKLSGTERSHAKATVMQAPRNLCG